MRKLQKLVLRNFQCWENQEIVFDEGLNVIIGDSDSGKSSILRAIVSCFNGRIDVDWIRHGSKELSVEMWFTDGCKAIRTRGKKVNTVSFIDQKGKQSDWERIGLGLPAEYLRMLGETEIKLPDGTSINPCISFQLDQHFFLTISDNFKAKVLGSISGLDIIDGALGLTITEYKESQNKVKNFNLRIEELQKQKIDIESEIKKTSEFYGKIEGLNLLILNMINLIQKIFNLYEKIKINKENIEIYKFKIKKEAKFLENLISSSESLGKVKQLEKVSRLSQGITSSKHTIEFQGKQKEMSSRILSVLREVSDKAEILGKLISINKKMKEIICDEYEGDIEEYGNKIKELKKQSAEIFKDIEQCPLCGQIIGKNNV